MSNNKNKTQHKLIVVCHAVVFSFCLWTKPNEIFLYTMDTGCACHKNLTNYVKNVTNEHSAGFIPAEDRIAVFDMDGTLMCETFPAYFEWLMFTERVLNDPTYTASEAVRQEAVRVRDAIDAGNKFPEDMERTEAIMGAQAFAGMTTEQYADYIRAFMETPADGFENLKRGDALYLPMLEIIAYLQQNEFVVYIVTGTDRFAVRRGFRRKKKAFQPQAKGFVTICGSL